MFCMENEAFGIANSRSSSRAPSVGKAASILDLVSRSDAPVGVSEIARRAGLSKSTVHGIIAELSEQRLLQGSARGGYRLGSRLAELGARAIDQRTLDVAQPALDRLADDIGETALFGRLANRQVVVRARSRGVRPLALSARIGSFVPLLAGALGAAYLASLPPAEVQPWLRTTELPRFTPTSVTEVEHYIRLVAVAKDQGYAVERGQYLPGIAAAAAAFHVNTDTYFVWIVGIDTTLDDTDLHRAGRQVRATADSIAGALGAAPEGAAGGTGL
ncbi:MAG TPA: IclR family transcriptional regulator [Chloroflexota bacterium]